jgi:beta-hydroxylase
LRIPEGDVRLKVGDETAAWEEGGLLVFAPTSPHTSWNLTEEWRVVLIVDFFKPEEDRAEMVAMERAQFATLMRKSPASFGMSGGMFELDEEIKRRFAVPRIESRLKPEERRPPPR